jgi:hypothetical protein
MTTETPLDWVLLEAEKRCEWEFSIEKLRFEYHHEDSTCFRALCDMIAKHEKPPVDRKARYFNRYLTDAEVDEQVAQMRSEK